MLDLDHFKSYNDTHGHQAGDRLLVSVAAAWAAKVRSTDLIARYGGEEFIVILPDCAVDEAIITADRLRHVIPGDATASAGVATLEIATQPPSSSAAPTTPCITPRPPVATAPARPS